MTTTAPAAPAALDSAAPGAPALDAEKAELIGALADARSALTQTVAGLDDEQAGEHPTVSALCLGGLVKHVAGTEEGWLKFAIEGASTISYDLPEGVTWDDLMSGTVTEWPQWMVERQNEFTMLPGETLAGILADYERVAARTEELIATADLSVRHDLPEAPWHEPGGSQSVRQVLLHVIAETSQHAGHADIVREALDGRTAT